MGLIPNVHGEGDLMPRFRFTIRWMMVAVAILGVVFAGLQFRQIAVKHATRAVRHAEQEAVIRERLDTIWEDTRDGTHILRNRDTSTLTLDPPGFVFGFFTSGFPDGFRSLEGWHRLAAWHGALKRKYDHAARYPWLPVAPDPREPK